MEFRDCPECPEMIVIPSGSFNMGSNNGDNDEKPMHRVTLAKAFAIGKTEVTQIQWRAVMQDQWRTVLVKIRVIFQAAVTTARWTGQLERSANIYSKTQCQNPQTISAAD